MVVVTGKNQIYAKVLADSISPQGIRMISFECSYPRIIHCELLTHGMLNFNSASSRATPFEKMAQNLEGMPVRFGANQSGMQDKGEDYDVRVNIGPALHLGHEYKLTPEQAWFAASESALAFSRAFYEAGYHKQIYNRLTEASQMMKTIISGTEFANFFWLRHHDAADPTLQELARVMYEAAQQSTPQELQPGEWHLPYVESWRDKNGVLRYYIDVDSMEHDGVDSITLSLEEAQKVSAARCAAVSFRNVDYTLDKSEQVYERLLGDKRKHGSAFQHQGTPIQPARLSHFGPNGSQIWNWQEHSSTWEAGITHADREGQLWSAQLRGWVQFRKLIAGENVPGFFPEAL